MKTLLLRAFKVRSNKQLRKKEINNLGNTSNHSHGYPIAVIQNDIQKLKKNNPTHLLLLQKINKMMFLRVTYLSSHIRGKEEK